MTLVAWESVTVVAPTRKKKESPRALLTDASGYACSGDACGIVALMGSSGSGKTTLLTLLAGHTIADSGVVTLNGSSDTFHSQTIGFVPQFDHLFESLTVVETVRLGSTLRGSRRSPTAVDAADDARLRALLDDLGLLHVADTRIGQAGATGRRRGISGGERKRCALALELLHAPPLLVLDEPTSGLDSRAALDVMRVLVRLTATQAVIISLHQPSTKALGLVGQLGLLSPTGRTLYFGPAARALAHFEALGHPVPPYTNPAEHYIELIADATNDPLQDLLLGRAPDVAAVRSALSTACGKTAGATPPAAAVSEGVGFGRQLRALHWRASTHNKRHPAFVRAMFSRSVLMALVVGYLYSGLDTSQASVQDRTGALYFVLTNQIMSASASIRTFVAEREIARHELQSRLYRLPAYFGARSLAEATLHVLFALLFGSIAYALVGLAPTLAQLAVFLAITVLVTLCAESFVILVGCLMPDEKSAAVVGPIFLALNMVSGGLFVNVQSMPAFFRFYNVANPFAYGFAALLPNEFTGLTFTCGPHELVGLPPPQGHAQKLAASLLGDDWPAQRCPVLRGDDVVERMGLGGSTPADNAAALVLMVVAYRALALWVLHVRFKRV